MDRALLVVPICRRAAIHLMGIRNNVLSPAPPIHDVIDRAGILHSHRARHRTSLTRTAPTVKRDRGCGRLRFVPAGTTYGLTPLMIVLLAIWDGVWKLIALWKSARTNQILINGTVRA